jgi:hypothetical protein
VSAPRGTITLAAGLIAAGAEAVGVGEARGATAVVTGVINKYGAGVASYLFGQAAKVGSVPAGTPLISGKELLHALTPLANLYYSYRDLNESCF